MTLQRKLRILADAAKYDASCASSGSKASRSSDGLGSTEGMGICHSYTPDGRCVSLLKILLTNSCMYDCRFCINRSSSDTPRAAFSVAEVVQLTMDFYRRNYIEGLFLSSGIVRSEDDTMEQLVEVARRLREEESFGGYIHLKVIAGASARLLQRAGLYADRLSCNVELPTESDLARLAPEKRRATIDRSMTEVASEIRGRREDQPRPDAASAHARSRSGSEPFAPAGQSTQMVVGATDTSDQTILESASTLYRTHALRRVYYSAYSPITDADPNLPTRAVPLVREHRLYQADWLFRFYGFEVAELFEGSTALPLHIDPKLAWASRHLDRFPMNLNDASREELLRVPGLGERTVRRVLLARRHGRLRSDDLAAFRVSLKKVAPFVYGLEGPKAHHRVLERTLRQRVREPNAQQLPLFDACAA